MTRTRTTTAESAPIPGHDTSARGLSPLWKVAFGIAVACSVVMMYVPDHMYADLVFFNGVIVFALVAALVGVRRSSAEGRRIAVLLAVSLALSTAAEGLWWVFAWMLDIDPYPSFADVFFLLSYVPLIAVARLLDSSGTRQSSRAAWLDTAALTAIAGVIVWNDSIYPVLSEPGSSFLVGTVDTLYPLLDLIVFGMVLRLLLTRGTKKRTALLFAAAAASMFAADVGFAFADLTGLVYAQYAPDLLWLLGYLFLGAAALMAPSPTKSAADDLGLSRSRLMLLLTAVMVPNLLVAREVLLGVDDLQRLVAVVVLSIFVMAVVTLRLFGLITIARQAEARRGQDRLSALIHHSADAVVLVDEDGWIGWASPAANRILDLPVEGRRERLTDLLASNAQQDFAEELRIAASRISGSIRRFESTLPGGQDDRVLEGTINNLLDDQNVGSLVVTMRDVTDRRRMEDELERRAFHDDLTGLANRSVFVDRLSHALARRTRTTDTELAVLFIDLDDFKAVNDGMGHQAGDQLLQGVAARLESAVRPADTVARLGGDEFAVLMEDVPTTEHVRRISERLVELLQMPLEAGDLALPAPASIGVAFARSDSSVESLMRDADIAMYEAKRHKDDGMGVAVFEHHLGAKAIDRLALKVDLPNAIAEEQFNVVYQPIYDIETKTLGGFEALVRWNHPERGVISPLDFIPIAEETGTIVDLGRWVLRTACRQAAEWNGQADHPLRMNVNVSGVQLRDPDFVGDLEAAIADCGLAADLLVIELTESTLVDHRNVGERMVAIRDLGVGIAIDDFGTGYSSLSYIQTFPITSVKIDRSFISDMSRGADARVVKTILSMADTLGYTTVAEGIEDDDQLARLRSLGCNLGQGFKLGRPERAEHISALLQQQAATVH